MLLKNAFSNFTFKYGQLVLNSLVLVMIIFNCLLLSLISYYSDTRLKIEFFDVGQGDSFLIQTPDKVNMLVDGGEGKSLIKKLSENMSLLDNINVVLLTHAHADHVGALADVVNTREVNTVFVNPTKFSTQEFETFIQAVDESGTASLTVNKGDRYQLGCCVVLNFLWPTSSLGNPQDALIDSANQESISFLLQYGSFDFLSSGDLEGEIEEEVAKSVREKKFLKDGSVDLVKISHHGSDTSTSEKYLNIIQPDVAVIQVGKGNDYNHPASEIVTQIDQKGAQLFRTDLAGDVVYLTDSYTYFIQSDK